MGDAMLSRFVASGACLLILAGCSRRETLSWKTLIAELAQPERIAESDQPATRMFSSYDRTGGNDDFSTGFTKDPDGWLVLADLKGPGCLSRFWFTGAREESTFRFHFDNEAEARWSFTPATFRTGEGFFRPPFASADQYCYYLGFPIPYRERLRVLVSDEGYSRKENKLFFQIHATRFERRTVDSAVFPVPQEVQAAADRVREAWARLGQMNAWQNEQALAIGAGEVADGMGLKGPGTITRLGLAFPGWPSMPFEQRCAILRSLWVRIYWDGCAAPSVNAPVGDLFGLMWQPLDFHSMYFACKAGAMENRFPMPFRSSARIEIENRGPVPVDIIGRVNHQPGNPAPGRGYFHCGRLQTDPARKGSPHVVLDVKGAGRLAGCLLGAASMDRSFWVLESDETMTRFEDQDPFWQGTGLEDYFNGGWYYRTVFAEPLYGLTLKRPYRTVQYRFHLTDAVTFRKGLRMSFERGPGHQSNAYFDSAVYYYMSEPQRSYGADARGRPAGEPPDELAANTVMTRLWDYEKFGDPDNARALTEYALRAYRYPSPAREMLQLRILEYRAILEGYETVKPQFHAMTNGVPEEVAVAAGNLIRFHEDGWVLIGVYASRPAELWLDGERLGRSESHTRALVRAVPPATGERVLAARTATGDWPHWVQVAYRTRMSSGGVDRSWRKAVDPSGDWRRVDYDDSGWDAVAGLAKGPPEMEAVPYVEPDPYVYLQSQAGAVRPAGRPGGKPGTIVLRKVMDIAPSRADSLPAVAGNGGTMQP